MVRMEAPYRGQVLARLNSIPPTRGSRLRPSPPPPPEAVAWLRKKEGSGEGEGRGGLCQLRLKVEPNPWIGFRVNSLIKAPALTLGQVQILYRCACKVPDLGCILSSMRVRLKHGAHFSFHCLPYPRRLGI